MATILRILLLPILLSLLSSCSNKSKDKKLIEILNESLEKSTTTANFGVYNNIRELKNKSTEPATAERATIWLSKAEKISSLSAEIYKWVEHLKKQEKITSSSSSELSTKLIQYKNDILLIDEKINAEFEKNLVLVSNSIDTLLIKEKGALPDFLTSIDKQSANAMLSGIQANIRTIEIRITSFCNAQVGVSCDLGLIDYYYLLVGQSSNSVSAGSEIEITAGIGAFSKAAQPKVYFADKLVYLNENGYSSYKIKAPAKPGTYKVTVKVDYFNQTTGKREVRIVPVEYTVTPPCN